MINRVWRGWTRPENGDRYERLLRQEIFPGIAAKGVRGYRGVKLLRRQLPSGEFEFMTIMRFDSLESVKAFAGADYERAYVPEAARRVLSRFDEVSAHYEVREELSYGARARTSRARRAGPTSEPEAFEDRGHHDPEAVEDSNDQRAAVLEGHVPREPAAVVDAPRYRRPPRLDGVVATTEARIEEAICPW